MVKRKNEKSKKSAKRKAKRSLFKRLKTWKSRIFRKRIPKITGKDRLKSNDQVMETHLSEYLANSGIVSRFGSKIPAISLTGEYRKCLKLDNSDKVDDTNYTKPKDIKKKQKKKSSAKDDLVYEMPSYTELIEYMAEHPNSSKNYEDLTAVEIAQLSRNNPKKFQRQVITNTMLSLALCQPTVAEKTLFNQERDEKSWDSSFDFEKGPFGIFGYNVEVTKFDCCEKTVCRCSCKAQDPCVCRSRSKSCKDQVKSCKDQSKTKSDKGQTKTNKHGASQSVVKLVKTDGQSTQKSTTKNQSAVNSREQRSKSESSKKGMAPGIVVKGLFFDIVTKPNFQLQFVGPRNQQSVVELTLHNPNHAKLLAYTIRVSHHDDYVVIPKDGILESLDRHTIRITRKMNTEERSTDKAVLTYTQVSQGTRIVTEMMFQDKTACKRKEFLIKH